MDKLKIHNIINDNVWKKIPCCCLDKTNPEKCFPLMKCSHCQCETQEKSCPKNNFYVYERKITNGELSTTRYKREIKEIWIDRSTDGLESIRGWYF